MLKEFKNIAIFLLILGLVFSPIKINVAQAEEPSFNIYQIADGGTNLDADTDSDGNTYATYERSGSIYIVKNRGDEELVGSGTNPSLAIDNFGSPHIAYISAGSVIYETYDGDWDNDEVVPVGESASATDIDIDSSGKAHIIARAKYFDDGYCSSIADVVYFSNSSGSFTLLRGWNGESCYDNPDRNYYDSHPISIVIDNTDNYHLLFWHKNIYKTFWDSSTSYDLQYHTSNSGSSVNKTGNFALYKNSLAIDALGRANVVYGATKHALITGGTWSETDLGAMINPAISSNNSAIGISYTSSGVNYYENDGSGIGQSTLVDSIGDNSALALSNAYRFVYYLKDGKIYLATDKTIYNVPIITGVEDGGAYNIDKDISWDHGNGQLNGVNVNSPITVSEEGDYNITVVNDDGKSSSVDFVIDKTAPIITIDPYNTAPTNQDITVTASTSEGSLNATTHTFSENGSFEFIATDAAGNQSSQIVNITNIDKTSPKITIGFYDTSPTNQDITVTASTDEGSLNADSHTFSENGSFDFVATDPAGNSSTYTVTIENIDKIVPIITVAPFSTSWTNQDIVVTATTNEGTLNTDLHTFSENGSFDFVATDLAGNKTTTTVTVDNIDKTKPSSALITSPVDNSHIRQSIKIEANTSDDESGIEKVEFFSSIHGKIGEDNEAPFKMNWDTTVLSDSDQTIWVTASDRAGNKSDSTPVPVTIDNTAPVITIGDYNTAPTNQDITVTASTNEGALNSTSHTFTENGSFEFIATDEAGNVTKQSIVINNIDKTGPIITISDYDKKPTNQSITITASVDEGSLNATSHTFTENGSFEFIATDALGNQTKRNITITNIDKNSPKSKLSNISSGQLFRSSITLTADIEEEGSGVDKVEFYHASDETLIGTVTTAPFSIDWNTSLVEDGEHRVWTIVYDKAGNKTVSEKVDIEVDNTAPVISIAPYSTAPTTKSITVYAFTNEGTLNATSHTFTENGSFDFIAIDKAGNKTVKTVTIANISKASKSDSTEPTREVENSPLTPVSNNLLSTSEESDDHSDRVLVAKINDVDRETTTDTVASTAEEEILESSDSTPEVKGESIEAEKNYDYLYWLIPLILIFIAIPSYYLTRRGDK